MKKLEVLYKVGDLFKLPDSSYVRQVSGDNLIIVNSVIIRKLAVPV